ncbi:MAG: tRNA (N(6)-L-threonylcarbamoyladenosine(37)-C(2))-methylthiotransferase MtaB [Candidatus Omnitrophota bacterium]|nr:tRNA (N(6)-L-threonylcarbamoyladenosine(37)-C(2))-methylthiotransferase MtaB [Candidatus Omnitrophota bacterium]
MKVKFYTLGCKVNQYETQALSEEFSSWGCQLTTGVADLYVVNTCTVTSRADSKSREIILRAKRENPRAQIAVCGCMAQESSNIHKLDVDYVIPQKNKQFVADAILNKPAEKKDIWSLKISRFYNQRAFVKIQDGCDNECSFCKVPYVRGKSRSREEKEVIEEIERISLSHKEVVLCGINLGLYGKDLNPSKSLHALIDKVLATSSVGRLRLSSLEPSLADREVFKLFYNERLCPHLHFPFQSGDDRVLQYMNKKETVASYEEIVHDLRKINPSIAISCDIIVGFPYEDEESFKNTVAFLEKVRPMRTHIFTFSPRENTRFYGTKIKNYSSIRQRRSYLKKITSEFSLEYKKNFLGKTLKVVAEEKNNGYVCGYSENYIKVYLKEIVALGQIYPVKIVKVDKENVFGCRV